MKNYHPRHNPQEEATQIFIEEQFQAEVMDGKADPVYVHYLATHPQEYREWRESEEDMRRFNL